VERKEVPLLNSDALREAVINAVLHSLRIEGNAPMITVFLIESRSFLMAGFLLGR
jgi:predicted HTH transcriptional regulator